MDKPTCTASCNVILRLPRPCGAANEHPQSLLSPFPVVDSPGPKYGETAAKGFPVSSVHHFEPKPRPCHFAHFNARAVNMTINVQIRWHAQCLKGMKGGSFPKPSRFPQRCQRDSTSWRYFNPSRLTPVSFMAVSNCTSISGTNSALKNGTKVLQKRGG